jgi:hypothetical protein
MFTVEEEHRLRARHRGNVFVFDEFAIGISESIPLKCEVPPPIYRIFRYRRCQRVEVVGGKVLVVCTCTGFESVLSDPTKLLNNGIIEVAYEMSIRSAESLSLHRGDVLKIPDNFFGADFASDRVRSGLTQ